MGRRGKVQLQRIDNAQSRQVAFTKRRKGLFKKALELSVLCDVQVALFVLSGSGRPYHFSSGNSINKILEPYCTNLHSEQIDPKAQKTHPEFAAPRNGNNCLLLLQRLLEGLNVENLNTIDIFQLEQLLDLALRQTQDLKAQLMLNSAAVYHKKESRMLEGEQLLQNTNENDAIMVTASEEENNEKKHACLEVDEDHQGCDGVEEWFNLRDWCENEMVGLDDGECS